jgi:hypothetical protein
METKEPRNELEWEVLHIRHLDLEDFYRSITQNSCNDLYRFLYHVAIWRAFKSVELLELSIETMRAFFSKACRDDHRELAHASDVAFNVAYHMSRVSTIYMEAARLVANNIIAGHNNMTNRELDDYIEGMTLDQPDSYFLAGGAPADDTFSVYLDSFEPPSVLQTLQVSDQFLEKIGYFEGREIPCIELASSF